MDHTIFPKITKEEVKIILYIIAITLDKSTALGLLTNRTN